MWISVSLHVSVLGALGVSVLMQTCTQREPERLVMTLAAAPSETPRPPMAQREQAQPTPAPRPLEVPRLESLPEIDPAQVQAPQPQPQAAAPPPRPEPQPRPTPETPAEPALSYEDFIRQQGQPQVTRSRSRPAPASPAPRIDTSSVKERLQNLANRQMDLPPAPAGRAHSTAFQRYAQSLHAAIQARFENPLADERRERVAVITFDIEANGRLSNIRLVTSSGSNAFDQAARAAVAATATGIGAPPDRQRHSGILLSFSNQEQ